MTSLRRILQSICLPTYLNRRARTYITERQFRNIRRGKVDSCWCGGGLLPFKWHASYKVCTKCGTYVNCRPPLPEELKRLYSFELYWHTRQQLKGFPVIEQRPANDRSDGRVDYWLGLIKRYRPSTGLVVEVGCAHGVLLAELKARGYKCIGVEPDERTAEWARENVGLDVRPGLFPNVDLPKCDLFLGFDVIEHSPVPVAFMNGVAQLLNPGCVAIIQTPIDRYAYQPPFGDMFGLVFDDLEHLYIFTQTSLRRLSETAGLMAIAEDSWRLAHEIVVLRRE